MAHVTLKRGDRLLLCSDGLHDYFPTEEEIAQKLSADAPGDALKDMVELAKTRGGHDNITGVAVQVTEVVEAVPAQLEGEHTQPVDAPATNPFASDEPTETALIDAAGSPPEVAAGSAPGASPGSAPSSSSDEASLLPTVPRTPQELKETQPMRIVNEDAVGDTIPPIDEPARLDPPPEPGSGADSAAGPSDPTGAKGDAKADANVDAKAEARTDAKTGGTDSAAASKAVVRTDDPAGATDATVDDTIDVPGDAPDAEGAAPSEVHANGDRKPSDGPDAKASEADAAPGELAVGESGRVRARRNGKDA
jgi:hypothetical protein